MLLKQVFSRVTKYADVKPIFKKIPELTRKTKPISILPSVSKII